MRIVLAPDSFKGSLTAAEAAEALREGVLDSRPDCDTACVPLADGGEGTAAILAEALGALPVTVATVDPLMRPVEAGYALSADGLTAVIDIASASGLTLVEPSLRDPSRASTRGTGLLVADALGRGARHIIVGLGGSATNDGGRGLLEALGYRFETSGGQITGIDDSRRHPALDGMRFTAVCDVETPMCGPEGATHVFAPQKGADPAMVDELERQMTALARVYGSYSGRDFASMPHGGAAGATGAGLAAVLGADLRPGIDVVLEAVGFDSIIDGADLVITGEGRIDRQTQMGKTLSGVLAAGQRHGVPVAAVGGTVEWSVELANAPFHAIIEARPTGMELAEAMKNEVARHNLRHAAKWLTDNL